MPTWGVVLILLIGVVVLCFAVADDSDTDWRATALKFLIGIASIVFGLVVLIIRFHIAV